MAYENTGVEVYKSYGEITKLVMARGGSAVGIQSEPPNEGFHAKIAIDGCDYLIRVTAKCAEPPKTKTRYGTEWDLEPAEIAKFVEQERRRVWRVLFYYLKNAFECADSGVVELREVLLPHIVTRDGKTIGEHLLPGLEKKIQADPRRLLGDGK